MAFSFGSMKNYIIQFVELQNNRFPTSLCQNSNLRFFWINLENLTYVTVSTSSGTLGIFQIMLISSSALAGIIPFEWFSISKLFYDCCCTGNELYIVGGSNNSMLLITTVSNFILFGCAETCINGWCTWLLQAPHWCMSKATEVTEGRLTISII